MRVEGKPYRTIWLDEKHPGTVGIIDQRALPHEFVVESIGTWERMEEAIREMHVRGAPLIGVAGAFGLYLAAYRAPLDAGFWDSVWKAAAQLRKARPTAVNLAWAVEQVAEAIQAAGSPLQAREAALRKAQQLAEQDVECCRLIGRHGLPLIEEISRRKGATPVNILTHCNAGWLACVDHGTATSPIYTAHDAGIPVHVWVDETRPRNQGASLTAWELSRHGVPHTVIADNTGGHLMQHAMVDIAIVGTDRTTATGDVANKIGTYLKALAAYDNEVPFYVALPSSSIDWEMEDGIREIPIEERDADEVRFVTGRCDDGKLRRVRILPEGSRAANYGFDVTPARLVTGFITERGICSGGAGLAELFPERSGKSRPQGLA